jgi:hypothetical protein
MKANMINPRHIEEMKRELQRVRKESLAATRMGDYLKIARLTTEAAKLNAAISEAEGIVAFSDV